ncbi:MAG: hypothetical protein K2Q26_13715, partial [Bdellovibrionales bacterium]|nr:hypothetical protein [Bdellovibrionales bacterium]
MFSNLIWLTAIGPAGLILSGLLFPFLYSQRRSLAHGVIRAWALFCILVSIVSLAWVYSQAPLQTPLLGLHGVGLSLYLDKISASLLLLVSFIGFVVLSYSRHYLAGDPGHSRFMRWTVLTLGSVLILIISGNLALFYGAWVATSIYLHQLLTFYSERPSAILAARKKRVVSRLSDVFILFALLVLYRQFGSLEYTAILQGAQA